MTESGSTDAPGPADSEALRLLSSAQEWAQEWAQRALPGTAAGHGGPECQWCPLCQFVAVLRGDRPEISQRVAEAGVGIVSALRSLVDAAADGASRADQAGGANGGSRDPDARGTDRKDAGTGPRRVQRIDLGGEPGQ